MIQGQYSLTYVLSLFPATDPSGISIKRLRGNFSGFTLVFTDSSWNDYSMNVGSSTIVVEAIDNQNNISFKNVSLTIQQAPDTTPPTISSDITVLDFYKSTYPTGVDPNVQNNLLTNITTVSDNLDPNPTRELDKNLTLLFGSVNTITYGIRARDNANNVSNYIYITFNYIDDVTPPPDSEAPVLTATETNIVFYTTDYPNGVTAAQVKSALESKLTATDNVAIEDIYFDPTVQDFAPGEYGAQQYFAYAKDTSGNFSNYITMYASYVNAIPDTIDPVITGPNSLTLYKEDNKTINYVISYYTLTDDSGFAEWYQLPNIIFNIVGTFQITLQAIDNNNNIGSKNITINVLTRDTPPEEENIPPVITGDSIITIYVGDSYTESSFLNTFYTIFDPAGIKNKYLSPSVNFGVASTYLTSIFAIDNFDNVASKSIQINILEGSNPGPGPTPGNSILENVFVDGELMTNKIKVGFTFNDKLDVELDSATIVIPYTTRQEPYIPFTQVKFTFANSNNSIIYYITDDSVTRLSASQNYFQHSIVLIEPTKILERFKCVDMTFTQPIDDSFAPYTLLNVVNRISYNNPVKTINDTTSYWDNIDNTLSNLLASIKAPQLQFRSMTVREALDRTFQYINAVTRLKINDDGTKTLTADFFNTQDTLINLENTINVSRSQSSEFFAENSELTVENATTEYASVKYPSYGWAGVRSSSSLVDSSNIHIEVPFPIYEILSIKLFARVLVRAGGVVDTFYTETDITPYVLEKQLYDALPVGTLQRQFAKEKHTFNTFYYSRGDNKIYNIAPIADLSPLGFANNSRVVDLLFGTIWGDNDPPSGPAFVASWAPEKFSDLLFRIEYRTLLSSRLRFMRDVKHNFFGTIHTNQMENIVDLESLGANARGIINRVGNPDLTATKVAKTWEQRFKVGQFTSDGFIATSVENAVFNDHVRSTASFTKDYNGLSKFVGVDTEVRQIPIPLQTTKSIVHYDQFTILDTQPVVNSGVNHFAQNLLINQFSDYLKQIDDKTVVENYDVSTTLYNNGTYFTVPNNFGIIQVLLNGNIVTAGVPAYIYIIPEPEDQIGPFPPIYTTNTTSATYTNVPITVNLQPGQRYKLLLQRTQTDASFIKLTIKYITPYQFDKYMVKFISYTDLGQQIAKVAATPDISSINNSIKLDFYFNDNLSAGYSIDRNIADVGQFLTGQNRVLYTDIFGRFGLFEFSVGKINNPTTDSGKISLAERLPAIIDTDFYDNILVSPLIKHKKDNTENFGLTYQNHFLVSDNSQGHIVIGKKFLTKWFKSDNLNDITFKLFISETQTYGKFDNEKTRGTMLSSNDAYTITTLLANKQIRIDINADVSNAKSFAIGTSNGDLVLGFNAYHPYTNQYKNMTTIYLSFVDKRS